MHKTGIRCVVCIRLAACDGCRAGEGQPCARPSGHSGAFVQHHADRVLIADAAALARFPEAVRAAIDNDRRDPDALAGWQRNLRKLARLLERRGRGGEAIVVRMFDRTVTGHLDRCRASSAA